METGCTLTSPSRLHSNSVVRLKGRPPFDRIALLLQGGGALGAYQAGVYQGLAESEIEPDWIAGISIGAINSAIIAGNAPEDRVKQLRGFWEAITTSPPALGFLSWMQCSGDLSHRLTNYTSALGALLFGASNLFTPQRIAPYLLPAGSPGALSFYDVSPLRATLERFVDFGRINSQEVKLSVGAVNVHTGNFLYFDNTTRAIGPEHIMASGALPPGFPPVEIEGELYWDGGLVSNTPLQWVLDSEDRKDTLAFQVDLWSASGAVPRDLIESELRQKEIRYSSRTRAATDGFVRMQHLRHAVSRLLGNLPPELLQTPLVEALAPDVQEKLYNIVHLIYRPQKYEANAKDYEFSRRTMQEHWNAGYHDTIRTLRHPQVLQRHSETSVFTFDLATDGRF